MKLAKGFKGRYFSLAAITATSSQTTLHAQFCAYYEFFRFKITQEENEETEDPPDLLEAELLTKPCYKRRKKNLLLNTHLKPQYSKLKSKLPRRCRFRKTGLAPP